MKAGQLLSIEASDFLPPELNRILRQLHQESASLPYDTVKKLLLKELGSKRFHEIEALSQAPQP